MALQTISELTNNLYNELFYNSLSPIIKGPYILTVCSLLEKCGIQIPKTTDEYTEEIANAVKQFQKLAGIKVINGILNTETFQTLIKRAKSLMNDEIEDDSSNTEIPDNTEESNSPHYDSFFSDDKDKTFRKNNKDIQIIFGDGTIIKTIKDVFMRSVSVEVDTSGNPISEIYEFIARDVKESDELTDANKYTITEEVNNESQIRFPYSSSNYGKGTHVSSSGVIHGGGGLRR